MLTSILTQRSPLLIFMLPLLTFCPFSWHTESTYQQHRRGLVLLTGRIYPSQRHANLWGFRARAQGLPGWTHACWVFVRDFRRCRSVCKHGIEFVQMVVTVPLERLPSSPGCNVMVVMFWICFLGLLSEIPDPDLFLQDLLNSLPWWRTLQHIPPNVEPPHKKNVELLPTEKTRNHAETQHAIVMILPHLVPHASS